MTAAADSFRDAEILPDSHKVQTDAWMVCIGRNPQFKLLIMTIPWRLVVV